MKKIVSVAKYIGLYAYDEYDVEIIWNSKYLNN